MSIPLPPIYHLFFQQNHNNTIDNNDSEISSVKKEQDESSTNNKSNDKTNAVVHIHDLYLDAEERYEIFVVKAAERPHLLHYNNNNNNNNEQHETNDDETKKETNLKCNYCHESKECNIDHDVYDDDNDHDHDHDNSKLPPPPPPPPLIDGCDIPGWRKEQLVTSSFLTSITKTTSITTSSISSKDTTIQSLLNIGPSSTMFRKETQWPNLHKIVYGGSSSSSTTNENMSSESKWDVMKKKLNHEPTTNDCVKAKIVDYDDYCQFVETKIERHSNNDSSTSSSNLKMTKFAMEFEQPNIPAKIVGATKHWKCMPSISNNNVVVTDQVGNMNNDRSWT